MEQKISEYVSEPVLNVDVRQINSMLIYVIGRVNSIASGRITVNTNTNVLQALAIAGGSTPSPSGRASRFSARRTARRRFSGSTMTMW